MDLSIEEVQVHELEDLAILYDQLAGKPTNREKLRETFLKLEQRPDYVILGAKSQRQVIGSITGLLFYDMLEESQPYMYVDNVVVHEAHRCKGIGRHLMREIEVIARQKQCYCVVLLSAMHRERAQKFYQSIGYHHGVVQGYKKYLS